MRDLPSMANYLEHAHANVLRAVMYILTGDRALVHMRTIEVERRGGAFVEQILGEDDAEYVRRRAAQYLADPARESESKPTLTDESRVRTAIELLHGRPVSEAEFQLALREVSPETAPSAAWSDPGGDAHQSWRVLIIGAGFSGIAMAHKLEGLGIPYVVVDRQKRVGGTWERNQFPEARVDTTSFVYQFSFIDNFPWSEHYATQPEVREYLEHVARLHGIYPNIRLETKVTEAWYAPESGTWDVELEDASGRRWHEFVNAVVSASGVFAAPKIPSFVAAGEFGGEIIHSAEWDREFDAAGKHVGILGNGSTGVQILPWLAEHAEHVSVFQRTPQWISPLERYKEPVTAQMRWLHDNVPLYWRWFCYHARVLRSTIGDAQEYDPVWRAMGGKVSRRNDGLRANLQEYINLKLSERPDLVEACTPDFPPLARRLVVDNGWYDALLRPNVSFYSSGVSSLDRGGVLCEDGTCVPCDALILATGFDAQNYTLPAKYYGADGQTLESGWEKDGPRAYAGLEVPGFPNLFIMFGPNASTRGGSLVAAVELWAEYIGRTLVSAIESGAKAVQIKGTCYDRYNQAMDEEMTKLIWETEAPAGKNYYVNRHGRQNFNMPWRLHDYAQILSVAPEVTHDYLQ